MTIAAPDRRRWRALAPLGRGLALAAVTIVVCMLLYGSGSAPGAEGAGTTGQMVRIPLATKDAAFRIVPPSRGGATGSVWYRPRGTTLPLELRVAGLVPGARYRLDLYVDDTVYPVARLRATDAGTIAFDTTLTALAAGPGMGADSVRRHALDGRLAIRFWVQRDGSAAGNGDGDFGYALYEEAVAPFDGRAAPRP